MATNYSYTITDTPTCIIHTASSDALRKGITRGLIIQNKDTTNPVYIGGANVDVTNGIKIDPGIIFVISDIPISDSEIYAVCDAGIFVNISVMEML